MPSVAKSNKWFVRVDGVRSVLNDKVNELANCIDTVKLLCMFHKGKEGENPHIHFVIESNVILQQQSFAVRLKKLFEVEKKSQYSLKVWDGNDGACSYMFHEIEEVIFCHKGFDNNDLSKFRDLNSKVQEVIAINKQRGGRVVTRLVDEYKLNSDVPDREDILRRMLELIRDGDMYEPGDFQLMRYIEEVYLKTRPVHQWDQYVAGRAHRLFRNL